jgi:hypothetical protein
VAGLAGLVGESIDDDEAVDWLEVHPLITTTEVASKIMNHRLIIKRISRSFPTQTNYYAMPFKRTASSN